VDSSEFFSTEKDTSPWGTSETTRLNTELLDQIAGASSSTRSDLELAKALAELTHDEYRKYGTNGSELDTAEARKLLTTLKAVLARVGMRNVEFGFRDLKVGTAARTGDRLGHAA